MTPGVTGGSVQPPPIRGLLHGYAIPTINGQSTNNQ